MECCRRSKLERRVGLHVYQIVSEENTASSFRAQDAGIMYLREVRVYLEVAAALQPTQMTKQQHFHRCQNLESQILEWGQ